MPCTCCSYCRAYIQLTNLRLSRLQPATTTVAITLKRVRKAIITTTLHNHTEILIRYSASDLYCHNRNEREIPGAQRHPVPKTPPSSPSFAHSRRNGVDLGTRPSCNNNRTMNYDDINSLQNSNINRTILVDPSGQIWLKFPLPINPIIKH